MSDGVLILYNAPPLEDEVEGVRFRESVRGVDAEVAAGIPASEKKLENQQERKT